MSDSSRPSHIKLSKEPLSHQETNNERAVRSPFPSLFSPLRASRHEGRCFRLCKHHLGLQLGQEVLLGEFRYVESYVAVGANEQDTTMTNPKFVMKLLFTIEQRRHWESVSDCLWIRLENDVGPDRFANV